MSFIRINNLDVSALIDGFDLGDASVEVYDRALNDSLEGVTYSVKKAISFSTDYLTGSDSYALEGWVRGRGNQWNFQRYSNNTTQFSLYSNDGGVAMVGFNANPVASISTATLWSAWSYLLNPSGTLTATVPFGSDTDLTVSYMVRGGAINLVSSPEDFTVWSASAGVSAAASTVASPSGAAANLLTKTGTGTSAGMARGITPITGNGTKAFSVFLKAGTAASTEIGWYDATVAAWRNLVSFTWVNGVPSNFTSTSGSGTISSESFGNGWYRINLTANFVLAANANQFYIYPSGSGTASGTVYAWGAQAEDRTNLVSTDVSTWGLVSTTAASVASPGLGVPAYLLGTTAQGYATVASNYAARNAKTFRVYLKAGTSTFSHIAMSSYFTTGYSLIVKYTWSGGVPTASIETAFPSDAPSFVSVATPIAVGSGWYLCQFTCRAGPDIAIWPGGIGGSATNISVWFPETFEQDGPGQYDKLWYHRAVRILSGATTLWSNLHRNSAATVADIRDVSVTCVSGFSTITLQGKDINGTAASVCYANVLVAPYAMTTSMISARSTMTTGWAQLPFIGVSGDALPLPSLASGAEPGPITAKGFVKTLDYKPVVVDGVFRYNARALKISLEQR